MIDLLRLLKENYYHPGFNRSYSLKSVAPVLAPHLNYADFNIRDGAAASAQYASMIADGAHERDKAKTREDLLAYCARDTEALMHVYKALITEAGAASARS